MSTPRLEPARLNTYLLTNYAPTLLMGYVTGNQWRYYLRIRFNVYKKFLSMAVHQNLKRSLLMLILTLM